MCLSRRGDSGCQCCSLDERPPGLKMLAEMLVCVPILCPILVWPHSRPASKVGARLCTHLAPNGRASSVARRPPAWRTREPWRRFRRLAARAQVSHLAPRPLGPCGPGPVSFGRWMPFFPKGGGAYGDKAPLAPLRPWAPRTSDVRGLQKMPSLGAIITLTPRFSACPWGGWGFGKSPNALWPVPHDGHQLHPLPWSYYLPYLFGNFAHYIVQLALEP